jgi:hypothetical protein
MEGGIGMASAAPGEPATDAGANEWTPNQLRVIRELLGWTEELRPAGPPPSFPEGLVAALRARLEEALEPVASGFDAGRPLTIWKSDLSSVLKCEGLYLAPSDFEWSAANVVGKVVHKAIQISVAGRLSSAPPQELVQYAVDGFLAGDDALAVFLAGCTPSDMADVVSAATSCVTAFFANWPPIRPWMVPRVESRVKLPLCGGRIVLVGQYDLALGPPGVRTVITDLKTGLERPEHPEEARYYALLETLRNQLPPERVASYYLDGSWFRPQDVDEDVLESAFRRTVEGVTRMGELWRRARDPRLTPGPHCHYCPVREDCEPGTAWVAAARQERAGRR